ncbi:Alcohol dehydrogenase, class IV [Desulfoluna spongiiphila]|uniref:Alcohol dehydrogenase, class IV n=1 Tax=Desulfoluna spongiiphila TaxID=419481 RepID=A0A1G5J9Z4_9BACT|nr:Alcohol dehydrogenase, class IV [Desulfoluna spongiiphila]
MDTGVTQFLFPSKIGAGARALEHLPFDLGGFGAQRPMVVCSGELDSEGGLKPLEAAFKGSGLTFGVYAMDDIPSLETVREVWTHYDEGGFDAVIAVGGGAVVDVAKGLAVAAAGGPEALRSLLADGGTAGATAPLAWVPTLALTGREAAPEAALESRLIQGTCLCPNLIAVDPRMLANQGHTGLAEAGLGALAAALSLYDSGAVNPLARPYARLTAQRIIAGLTPLVFKPREPGGRLSRWFGSEGKREEEVAFVTAMAVSGGLLPEARKSTTFVLADVLAPVATVSREVLAAVLLPTVLEYAHRVRGEELSDLLAALGDLDLLCATPVQQRTEAALAMVRETINRLWLFSEGGLPRTLSEAGLERETLLGLCEQASAMVEGWQSHEVETLLLSAYNGTRLDPRNQSTRAIQEVS